MKKIQIAGLVLLGLLFFVWPVPRTISARDLLLVSNLCVFGYLAWCRGWLRPMRELIIPAVVLTTLTVWMYLVAVFVSLETVWTLHEISSQWIRSLTTLVIGVLVAVAVGTESQFKQKTLLTIFIALMLHVLYVGILALLQWPREWMTGMELGRISGLAGGADKSNYITNILFCFLLAESFYRLAQKKKMLPIGNGVLGLAIGIALLSMAAERMRNGVAVLVLMVLAAGLLHLFAQTNRLKKRFLALGVSILVLIAIAGLGLAVIIKPVNHSSGLKNLLDTAVIAWDTEHNKGWQDEKKYGLPVLPSGEAVDASAYMRIAWFKQGLLLIKEHPLGIGFGRNAYGHGLKAKYGEGRGHSHSGLLDLAIGIGVPGTLLWLGFFASLLSLAWKRYRATQNYAAVLLMLLSLDFGARMVVDSVIRDHMLQQFMFLIGLTAVMMVTESSGKRKAVS